MLRNNLLGGGGGVLNGILERINCMVIKMAKHLVALALVLSLSGDLTSSACICG